MGQAMHHSEKILSAPTDAFWLSDNRVQVWNATTSEMDRVLGDFARVTSVAFSDDVGRPTRTRPACYMQITITGKMERVVDRCQKGLLF